MMRTLRIEYIHIRKQNREKRERMKKSDEKRFRGGRLGLAAHSHCPLREGLALLVPEFYAFSLLTG